MALRFRFLRRDPRPVFTDRSPRVRLYVSATPPLEDLGGVAASLALTVSAPTVVGSAVSVAVSAESASLALGTASPVLAFSAGVQVTAVSLAIQPTGPTVIGSALMLVPGVGLPLTTGDPVVQSVGAGGVGVVAQAVDLSLVAQAPTLATVVSVNVAGAILNLRLTPSAPAAVVRSVAVSPGTSLALTTSSPVVATAINVPAASVSLALTVTAPRLPSVEDELTPFLPAPVAGRWLVWNAGGTALENRTAEQVLSLIASSVNPGSGWWIQEDTLPNISAASVALSLTTAAPTLRRTANVAAQPVGIGLTPGTPTTTSSTGGTTYSLAAIDSARVTTWNLAGLTYGPGIPTRSTVYTTLNAATYGNGTVDATSAIQAAIDACPTGQVVQLGAGTFLKNGILYGKSGVTLRGSGTVARNGSGGTWLRRTNGAVEGVDAINAAEPDIVIGESRWTWGDVSTNLTANGAKGSYSISVASGSGFAAGQVVLLDELSLGGWQTDPQGHGRQVWASADWRTVWQKHNPKVDIIDDFDTGEFPSTPASAGEWFCRSDRPTCECKEIASVVGNTITFTTPLHIDYRTANTAQLTRLGYPAVSGFGLESITFSGGDDASVRFVNALRCWANNVEVHTWRGEGIDLTWANRCEVRQAYVHNGAFCVPGGVAYCVSLTHGTADCLFEDSIFRNANKVFVSRCSGAGSVVGYSYLDHGFISEAYGPGNAQWQEMGVGGSHMVGPHHMLFEGNLSFNGDNDHTHGNSIYHTYFRNWLTGHRSSFATHDAVTINDYTNTPGPGNDPLRCAGASAFSYWMSFIANVLGYPGVMIGWTYESTDADHAVYALGWENHGTIFDPDTTVAGRTLRDGNFDYLTNEVRWHGVGGAATTTPPTASTMPSSLYLAAKPSFFGAAEWPWVSAAGSTKTRTLPAKARYDAGAP